MASERWLQFLTSLGEELTLVGPLFEEAAHVPTMPTVYVDGGTRVRPSAAAFPMVSVGDGDSAGAGVALDEILPRDKDYSDLAFVLRSLPASVTRVHLLGFLGGRRDHELANFGEAHAFVSGHRASAEFSGHVIVARNIDREIRGLFSVFVLAPSTVEISGSCRYPYKGLLQPLSSVGLSNEGSGRVRVLSHGPCFLFSDVLR